MLTDLRLAGDLVGFVFAFANAGLIALYIVLADRVAKRPHPRGVDGLAAATLIAAVVVTQIGGWQAVRAFTDPTALLAGVGIRLCSYRSLVESNGSAWPTGSLRTVEPPPVSWSQVVVVVVAVDNPRLSTAFARVRVCAGVREAAGGAGGVVGLVLDGGAHPERAVQPGRVVEPPMYSNIAERS